MLRLIILAGAASVVLTAMPALAHGSHYVRHHHHRHWVPTRSVEGYGRDISYVGPGYDRHVIVASEPVPDTPRNRARFGGPMSRGGAMTEPAGD